MWSGIQYNHKITKKKNDGGKPSGSDAEVFLSDAIFLGFFTSTSSFFQFQAMFIYSEQKIAAHALILQGTGKLFFTQKGMFKPIPRYNILLVHTAIKWCIGKPFHFKKLIPWHYFVDKNNKII